ncbi:uncharacterized protein DSM5745_11599 [Aspergillus mulundensis]|uniref:Thioredoxin domain-containing protein n=1 Tax=Aspergillus mulundensis TaxID=1810919 RepID=A0A3D8Q4Y5_9EURO|nr:hypothetical protein DSM5745_11599 [Aspergillus mulundensis]RDW56730.1 hypothetical protein DSM5745_11599 [Aspergillus mulundensis]
MPAIQITTKAEFDALLESHPYVTLVATTSKNALNRLVGPTFNKKADEYASIAGKYALARFNIDEVPGIAEELNADINRTPILINIRGGEVHESWMVHAPQMVQQFVDRFAAKATEGN